MATQQLLQTRQKKKSSKEPVLFPSSVATEQQSMVLVKRLLAISVSCITYMRGLFPESSYGTRYLDDLCLKILREDKSCLGSLQIVKWIQGCFDALEKQYLRIAVLAVVTELYQFKFKYKTEVPQMDIISNQVNIVNGVCSKDFKQASRLLIRKLYLLMQNLGPLPNDVTLTMKLLYYNDVTPEDYQPPGFKEDHSPGDLLFDGNPVNLRVGSVSTGFHLMKVRVTTEKKRMVTVKSNLIQENGPTQIFHQGLDCDEEEEEGSTKNDPLPVGVDSSDTCPGWKTEASSFYLQDTGSKKMGVQETGRMLCPRASQQMEIRTDAADVSAIASLETDRRLVPSPVWSVQPPRHLHGVTEKIRSSVEEREAPALADALLMGFRLQEKISCLNLAFSQEEVTGPKKKRKVSEPEELLLEGRK